MFQPAKIVLTTTLSLMVSASLWAQSWKPAVEAVTSEIIQPGYTDLADKFSRLNQASKALCSVPNDETYQAAQNVWKDTMAAWMQVSWIHFGPISASTGRFDIQIWPIRKGITHKTINSLLSNKTLSEQDVNQAGVSVRGLTGTEYLLFSGSGGQLAMYQDATTSNRCKVLDRASLNAGMTAQNLSQAWQQDQFISPYKQGVDMLDDTQEYQSAASIIWNALLAELEFIQLRKLEGPLNIHGKKAKPTYAESWRSLTSFDNIKHQIKTLKTLYQLGFEPVIKASNPEINLRVMTGFDQLSAHLLTFKLPMKQLLKTEDGRVKIEAFRTALSNQYQLLRSDVTPITGFALGFNANDGD